MVQAPLYIQEKVHGVEVFHPGSGEVRSDGPDGIACPLPFVHSKKKKWNRQQAKTTPTIKIVLTMTHGVLFAPTSLL
ncbi:MAG: hypothetical protein NT166_14065 [Candidatus Aminicenantes bacterium]|nr:hypothetical protein [Candidatus Aminicenantes bacterium]